MEFSELTFRALQKMKLADSTVLLPVMTQSPSRISSQEPPIPKELKERTHAIVFFGYLGPRSQRRRDLREKIKLLDRQNKQNIIFEQSTDTNYQAVAYADAKVCLIAHAYHNQSGGEYHRLSEFGPFGCVPVLEEFSDTIGLNSFSRCGGAVFTSYQNLLTTAEDIITWIDEGKYRLSSRSISNWWRAGIQWEAMLPSLLGERQHNDSAKSTLINATGTAFTTKLSQYPTTRNNTVSQKKEMICWSPVTLRDEDSLCRVLRIINTTGTGCDEYLFATWDGSKTSKLVQKAISKGAHFVFLSDPCRDTGTCTYRETGKWGLRMITKFMWKYIHKMYPTTSWFWRIDDDTFFSGYNARKYLSQYDPQKEYFFGGLIKQWVSGMSFSLSKAALDKMVANFDNPSEEVDCSLENYLGDDKAISMCLRSLGIAITDLKDKQVKLAPAYYFLLSSSLHTQSVISFLALL